MVDKKLFCAASANSKPSTFFVIPFTKRFVRWEWRLPWIMDIAGDTAASRIANVLIFVHLAAWYLAGNTASFAVDEVICTSPRAFEYPQFCYNGTQIADYIAPPVNETLGYLAATTAQHLGLIFYGSMLGFFDGFFVFFPLFMFNAYADRFWMCVLGVLYSILVAIIRIVPINGDSLWPPFAATLRFWNESDHSGLYVGTLLNALLWLIAIVALFLIILCWMVLLYLRIKGKPYYLHVARAVGQRNHVLRLLDPSFAPEKKRKLAIAQREHVERVAFEAKLTGYASYRYRFVKYLRKLFGCEKKPENFHAPFETADSFFYPQRLWFALVFSGAVSMIITYYVVVLVPQVLYRMHSLLDFISAVLVYLGYPAVRHGTEVADKVFKAAMYGGLSTYYVVFIIQWLLIFRNYRARIFELRQGKYRADRGHFAMFRMVEYMTVQGMCFLAFYFLYMIAFVCSCLAGLLMYYFPAILQYSQHVVLPIVFDIFLVVLPIRIGELIFYRYICSGPAGVTVQNRRWLSAGEFVAIFAFLPFGIFQVFLRIAFSFFFQIATFPLLHHSTCPRAFEAWDPGHRAYQAMILTDHQINNPVVAMFCGLLWRNVQMKRRAVQARWTAENLPSELVQSEKKKQPMRPTSGYALMDAKAEDAVLAVVPPMPRTQKRNQRVVNKWLLAFTLLHNRHLQHDRKHYTAEETRKVTSIDRAYYRSLRSSYRPPVPIIPTHPSTAAGDTEHSPREQESPRRSPRELESPRSNDL